MYAHLLVQQKYVIIATFMRVIMEMLVATKLDNQFHYVYANYRFVTVYESRHPLFFRPSLILTETFLYCV